MGESQRGGKRTRPPPTGRGAAARGPRKAGLRPEASRSPQAPSGGRRGGGEARENPTNTTAAQIKPDTQRGRGIPKGRQCAHWRPYMPPLWENPAFWDWGDPTTEAAKAPEATQATRSGPVKAGPWATCLGLDGAATLRRGAGPKSSCSGVRAARAAPLWGLRIKDATLSRRG